ncbi:hypothetical protein OFL47_23340, partial [Pseudomonas aeruginosa]|nr:hypothetical protein [Pseudomonas aeruginosa]
MPTSGGVYRCRGLSLGDSGAVAATPIRVAFLNDDQTPAPLPVPRPSPCPGLLRIVQALDGGICRIKLDAGRRAPPPAPAGGGPGGRRPGGGGVIQPRPASPPPGPPPRGPRGGGGGPVRR